MIKKEELKSIYMSRPFRIRNADEYDLSNILDLFVDPTNGLIGPFDFSNSIIKGKMGSGKTMYLRANYAYYLYTLVPSLLEDNTFILPVYIRLSDFQHLSEPVEIYNEIIIKIIKEIIGVCKYLESAEALARLHSGASALQGIWSTDDIFPKTLKQLKKITACEYATKTLKSIHTQGSATSKFFNICANRERNFSEELKHNTVPSFDDVVSTCKELMDAFDTKVLLLLDEVGSTNKLFFKSSKNESSYFEILMNQLRTLPYVRTKIAIYPHSYSDILTETRYGEVISLECDLENNITQYKTLMERTSTLIDRYIKKSTLNKYDIEDLFSISTDNQLIIEQLINASYGNMRRLVHLLDMSMNISYERHNGEDKINIDDVINALKRQGEEMESKYQNKEKTFLSLLLELCKKRSTYKFTFPNKWKALNKFTNLSEEYNILGIQQVGAGRQGNVYRFDYSYCVYKDIPTHYIKSSERIDKTRSVVSGEPIQRIAQLSDELISQAKIKCKIEGTITFLSPDKNAGLITGTDKKSYLLVKDNIIQGDKKKELYACGRVSFIPTIITAGNTLLANQIELLD